ncbi:hypothetical protein [Bacillus infantis]|uniref:hypothetical protein n=1 Tax=Bacillus infantis TaxID=324767 RepID=UPI00321B50BF
MKKKFFILPLLSIIGLSACDIEESELNYDGKLRPVSEVEEIIADKLEVENPDLDLEVSVYEESED